MTDIDMDELQQKAEWRGRLVAAAVGRQFDDETLADMLNAGLSQAHGEGLLDAAWVCDQIAAKTTGERRHTATILSAAIKRLQKANAQTETPVG